MKAFALTLLSAAILMGCGAAEEEEKKETVSQPNAVTVNVANASIKEGNEGEGSVSLVIQLQKNAESDVTVTYKTQDNTAKAGKDYTALDGKVVILQGSKTANVNIKINSNTIHQSERDFLFNIDSVSGGNAVKGTVTITKVTITDDDPEPVISFKNDKTMVSESAGSLTVPVELDRLSEKPTSFKIALAGLGVKDLDYKIDSLDYTIPALSKAVNINLTILQDQLIEGTEDIQLTIGNVSNAKLGTVSLSKVFISGDLKLPDTAYTKFYNNGQYDSNAPSSEHPYQDAAYGWDTDARYQTNGYAGLFMQKIDNAGNPMPEDTTEHSCVTDNHTGLTFEVKHEITERPSGEDDLKLWGTANWRSKEHRYLWLEKDMKINGGQAGGVNAKEFSNNILVSANCSFPDRESPLYVNPSEGCTSAHYILMFNKAGYCGFKDWRLPSATELSTIVVYESQKSALDANYFKDENYPFLGGDAEVNYLSSTPSVDNDASVWCLNSKSKQIQLCNKQTYNYIRLVRGPKL